MTKFPQELGDGKQLWGPNEDGTYQISDGGGWIPGVYENRETALLALERTSEDLFWLQNEVNTRYADPVRRIITMAMLRRE